LASTHKEKAPENALDWRLGGLQSHSACGGKDRDCIGHTVLNGRMILNDELEILWKEMILSYF
jgi:hypothetical protein